MGDQVLYWQFALRQGEAKAFRQTYHDPVYNIVDWLSEVNYRIIGDDLPNGKVVHYNALQKILQEDRDPQGGSEHLSDMPEPNGPPADVLEDAPRRSGRPRNVPDRMGMVPYGDDPCTVT